MTAAHDWSTEAFFDTPERDSLDGGTTSGGDLWHTIGTRWGHSMHTMCSYHGMFPAKVAHHFIQQYSEPGDVVLDPFSGRGTTALQAKVEGRQAICNDLNPLAYVLSKAKVDPPTWTSVHRFLAGLESDYNRAHRVDRLDLSGISSDIRMLYHDNTLSQLYFIRQRLISKGRASWSRDELMIAGALAGIMHGAWRRDDTSQYLSISMPNTFSMSPTYVAKYIAENDLKKINQNVFERLRDKLARLYLDEIPGSAGKAYHSDAAALLVGNKIKENSVDLIVTSPPYLQVVNYGTANWIRLWLLGIDEVGREQGEGRKKLNAKLDHGHTYTSYLRFMLKSLLGAQRVLKRNGVAVFVIGDVKDPNKETAVPLAADLWRDIEARTNLRLLDLIKDDLQEANKVSRIWGETKGQATSRDCALVLALKDGDPDLSRSEVNWDESYKEGGPDAAHDRLRMLRQAS